MPEPTASNQLWRKKPVVIEAMLYTVESRDEVIEWAAANGVGIDDDGAEYDLASIEIRTLEGVMWADLGDWIIRGVKGEFYPCKPDIFEETYEPAESEDGSVAARDRPEMGRPYCECGNCDSTARKGGREVLLPAEAWAVAGSGDPSRLAVTPGHGRALVAQSRADGDEYPVEKHRGWWAVG